MNTHLRNDLESLKERLLKVAVAVEENMRKSVHALTELSIPLAGEVVAKDISIDRAEVDAEEECLKILALHQPVASDLRFVITVLKINNELEHIGDVAANISKRVSFISAEKKVAVPFDLDTMTSRVVFMLKSAIDAFLENDSRLAMGVCRDDEIVDNINRECYCKVRGMIAENSDSAMALINYLIVSKSFERIADLCTNIAEEVIYMRHSIIARHNLEVAAKIVESENGTY